jgi:hypothetical protein
VCFPFCGLLQNGAYPRDDGIGGNAVLFCVEVDAVKAGAGNDLAQIQEAAAEIRGSPFNPSTGTWRHRHSKME